MNAFAFLSTAESCQTGLFARLTYRRALETNVGIAPRLNGGEFLFLYKGLFSIGRYHATVRDVEMVLREKKGDDLLVLDASMAKTSHDVWRTLLAGLAEKFPQLKRHLESADESAEAQAGRKRKQQTAVYKVGFRDAIESLQGARRAAATPITMMIHGMNLSKAEQQDFLGKMIFSLSDIGQIINIVGISRSSAGVSNIKKLLQALTVKDKVFLRPL